MDDSRGAFEICLVARHCKAVFAECVADPALGQQAWIRSAQGDFNLWCAGINASGTDKSSLDYRLRTRPDVRDAVRDLVRALVEAVKNCRQLVVESELDSGLVAIREEFQSDARDPDRDSPRSSMSWDAMSNEYSGPASSSGDETSDPILSEQISYAKTILGQLQRSSLAIRKSGNKYRFEKADAALDESRFEEFRKHLTTVVLMAFEDKEAKELTAVQKMQQASDYDRLTLIQKRLVRANVLRRNRIEFVSGLPTRKSRPTSAVGQPEPTVDAGKLTAVEPVPIDADLGPSQPTPSVAITPPTETTPRESSRSVAHTTAATATDVGSKLDIKHILTSRASTTATKMTRIGSSQTYPGCPRPGPDGAVLCPYCDDILPLEYSWSKCKDSWKAHVVQDIIPYSCVIEDCSIADEMYLTANNLLAHTLERHSTTRWTCDYCALGAEEGNGSTDKEHVMFDSAEEWKSHIAVAHGDEIPVDQRGILAELNKRRVIGPLFCPLCEFNTGSMDTKIDDHILQHLHEFALRALPECAEETDGKGSRTSLAYGLLSHTRLNSIDKAIAREYPIMTLQEVEDAMDNALHFFSTSETMSFQSGLKRPLHSDAAAAELWQTKSRRLKEVLDTLKFLSQDSIGWDHPDIRKVAVEAVEETNSAAAANTQPPQIKQTNSIQHISVPSPPLYFTGRDGMLDALEGLLFPDQHSSQQSRIALLGPKGVGKTSIALTFVHRMREQSKDCSVFWVDASTENSVEQSFDAMVGEFAGLPGWTGSISDRVQSFVQHLTWTFNSRWLVVLDGLRHQTALHLSFGNLIPQGLKGSLLFTASDPTCLALLGPIKSIQVPNLDDEAAIQLAIQKGNDICLAALRLTDPRDDRARIQQTKGGLLKDSYRWILENQSFKTWREDYRSRVLWVKGDPGKGKTMLLCGIIHEMEKSTAGDSLLSYFFCQGTDSQINNATAVLRGLIYLLVKEQTSLISHVREKYDSDGKPLFTEANAWVALSEILTNILDDPRLKTACLIIDALDECETGLPQLLKFIVDNSSTSPRVKWIVSSRNSPEIEQHLKSDDSWTKLSLELTENAEQVAHSISAYIDIKVSEVPSLRDDDEERRQVRDVMRQKANGTFLWVALVIKELEKPDCLDPLQVVREVPADLYDLYERILDQIWRLQGALRFCQLILPVVTLAYRPLHLAELRVLLGLEISMNKVQKAVEFCGSFLTVQNSHIYFVHQSVKDYLSGKASSAIFPSGTHQVHYDIYSRSIQALSSGPLRRNTYDIPYLGRLIDDIVRPDPDPLAAVRYSCIYWINHLYEGIANSSNAKHQHELNDNGRVSHFLRLHFLHWLEASSLLRAMSDAVLSVAKLESLLSVQSPQSQLLHLAHDARRFALHNRWVIKNAPLQTYLSALIFSPTQSLIRDMFKPEEPSWISTKPVLESTWSPCLQTLEGHSDQVTSVAFSSDSKLVASGSGSDDKTIKIWDAATGQEVQTLKSHSRGVMSVAFSSDSKLVASGSHDKTIKIWDVAKGQEVQTLKGHSRGVISVAFSSDSKLVVSGSHDKTIKIWDTATGQEVQTLKGHSDLVSSVAFSSDSKLVASGSDDKTIKVWDAATGQEVQTLKGHSDWVTSVAFSSDSKLVASGSEDKTIKIWDAATGQEVQTLKGHSDWIRSVVFSSDSKLVASGSHDKTIKIWDAATGQEVQTLKGHSDWVTSVAFSSNSKLVVSGSRDKTIKIWDTATGQEVQTLKGHSDLVSSVAFSSDSKLVASGSDDKTIKVWDAATGQEVQTLKGHSDWVTTVAFSSDSKLVASGSHDKTIKIWDTAIGQEIQTLKGHSNRVTSVAFSSDSKLVASGSHDKTIKIWDAAKGQEVQTLKGHSDWVTTVAFSSDLKLVASGSHDKTIKIWDTVIGQEIQTLEGHSNRVTSVAFSSDSKLVASGSEDKTIKIWDAATGQEVQTLDVGNTVQKLSFDTSAPCLLTNVGPIRLNITSASSIEAKSQPLIQKSPSEAYGLLPGGQWISWDGSPILWLPPDCRPECSATSLLGVTIGCGSGRVIIFGFSGPPALR